MTEAVSEEVVVPGGGTSAGEGFEAMSALNDGFLGTGYSSSVEISFIVMGLIAAYVAIDTARYFLHGTRVLESVAGALGLTDR